MLKACAFAALLTLAACASAPPPKPLVVTQPPAPPPVVTPAPDSAPVSVVQEPAPVAPQDMPNLFDRMRTGFSLEDTDDPDSNKAVDEQLDWYANHPDYLDRAFDRADLFLYHIVTELEARGMPREIALLPVVESAFQPYAYSPARALGLWQFIPGTGSRYNLKQDWWYDGRRDVIESTRAALDYLNDLHTEFNDWLLAIAAYNCGEMNVERAIARNKAAGLPTDFWHLRLPAETRAYVPKLLAMKRLVSNPEYYGLAFSAIPNKPYFVQVDTGGQISMSVAAKISGVTAEDIYDLNPAFHRWATDPSGPYKLLVPADAADAFRASVAQLTPDQRLSVQQYTVQRGDSMNTVAKRFGTTAEVVRRLNELPAGPVVVGTELRIPSDTLQLPAKALRAAALVDGRTRHQRSFRHRMRITVHHGETLYAIARKNHMDVHALARMNGLKPNSHLRVGQHLHLRVAAADSSAADSNDDPGADDGAPAGKAGIAHCARRSRHRHCTSSHAAAQAALTHTVRHGETLFHVAQRYHVSVNQLSAWNSLSGTHIVPGQKLIVRPQG